MPDSPERRFVAIPAIEVPPGTVRMPKFLRLGNTLIKPNDLREALQSAYSRASIDLAKKKPVPVKDRLEAEG